MRMPALLAFAAALPLAACAAHQSPERLVETGYERGALAVAAIDRGDWATAERLLTTDRRAAADDPARLINLGRVYYETGRTGEALTAWRLALASEEHAEVRTADGRVASTEDLAREALARHDREVRSAATR